MDTRTATGPRHSADVRIHLAVKGRVFSVGQLGPGFVVLRDAVDHPPAEAEVTLSIDGHRKTWPVELVDGIVAGRRKTRIVGR
jgi:hypothetical protein